MDLALLIFDVGVGVGAVLVGLALLLLVVSLRGLGRDARSLAQDVRRLNRLLEEMSQVDAALEDRDQPADAEHASRQEPRRPQDRPETPPAEEVIGWWPGREPEGPVQSANQREDERIA